MNILFNNIKKEMEKEKPIKKLESDLIQIKEDVKCIKKDIADIFAILKQKENKKDPIKDNGGWFLF
tara:strand:+ start:893 stop:1090 length:198 start_codon:yes stop_codon:yes gene_type:complete